VVLSPLAQRLLQHIRKRDLMRPGDRVAIAVSGGADSVALLRLMLEIRGDLGVVLSVAHFNHSIRGEASDADEAFVRELAARYSLDFHLAQGDTRVHAQREKLSLETVGRHLRYFFFCSLGGELAVETRIDKVATAHTLDDQAETVLMRVIRGTGVSGLSAILPRLTISGDGGESHVEVIRPLLDFRRAELEAYLHTLNQPWREDATNTDLHHTRNRIRHTLLPLLEREFNPGVGPRLAELADIAYEEEQYWSRHIRDLNSESELFEFDLSGAKLWLDLNSSNANNTDPLPSSNASPRPSFIHPVSIQLSELLQMSVAEQRRVVRRATRGLCSLTFEEVNRILQLARGETQHEIDLTDGLKAWCERNVLKVGSYARANDSEPYEYRIPIPLDNSAQFSIGALHLRLSSQPSAEIGIDVYKLPAPELILRQWRPGDRFWPQHSSGPKKVKELLTDKHITGPERQLWPVIACGAEILWLRGFGIAHPYATGEGASDAIVITEGPLP
jgi:tRNA(Ile)-lysidine synthase